VTSAQLGETEEKMMRDTARAMLRDWLFARLDESAQAWLAGRITLLASDHGDPTLYVAFGLVPRRLGKGVLGLSAAEAAAAERCIPGWKPGEWSLADAGRILLLSGLPGRNPDFAPRFRALCQTADVAEAIALYRGLPLYPAPESLEPQAGEGLRSNMRSVFEAIVHNNPYPARYFDTHRWNHMLLKALFVGSRLAPIHGLDARANEELARIMRDFAHERWAAGRQAPFDIWRCVGPFASGAALADIDRVLASGTPVERKAAALALAASPDPAAQARLNKIPDLKEDIVSGALRWDVLA
jgi:hypothetical protein